MVEDKHGKNMQNLSEYMNTLKAKILVLGITGALVSTASNLPAQDTPGRWYLGLDAGLALQQDITIQDTGGAKLAFDPGVRLDLSGGLHLSKSWKAEVELGFIYNSVSSVGGESAGSDSPDYFQVPIMANVIYTLPLRGPISAYAGVGVGGVYGLLWTDLFGSEDSFSFGYQGILGVKYALNDNLDLGLSYKLLGTVEHDLGAATVDGTLSHSVLAVVTFKF